MPIFVGGTEINDIKIGNTEINEVYVGANKVWERGQSFTVTTDYANGYIGSSPQQYVEESGFFFITLLSPTISTRGAISPNTINIGGSSKSILELAYRRIHTTKTIRLWIVSSTELTNSGFTSIKIGNTTFNRTDAEFSSTSVGVTAPGFWHTWSWNVSSNPFGTGTGNSTVTAVVT